MLNSLTILPFQKKKAPKIVPGKAPLPWHSSLTRNLLSAMRAERPNQPKKRVVVFELAESVQTIEFPFTATETVVQSTEIASSDSETDEVGVR